MQDTWLRPDAVFDGQDLREGCALRIEAGRVADIVSGGDGEPLPGIVSPGYVDLQVNGGGGVLLNKTPDAAAMAEIAAAHRQFGTIGILPTVITDAPEVLGAAVEAAIAARGTPGVLGLHIEGPHISVARRGTHAERFVRPMDATTLAHVKRLRSAGVPVMITVAPEATTPGQIADLAAMGAVVSIGHSDASAEAARATIAAGITAATHLFNAMSPMQNREAGVVGAVINSNVTAGIIADGIHVADEMVGLAVRARPEPDRMFLVSDAMPTVGGPDHFELYGQELRLENGRLVNAEGSLAGAHLTVSTGAERLVTRIGLDPQTALRMGITVPARLMGLGHLARIKGRAAADLIHLTRDLQFSGYITAP